MGMGTKKDEWSTEQVWVDGFHHVSSCASFALILKFVNYFFNFPFLGLQILNRQEQGNNYILIPFSPK